MSTTAHSAVAQPLRHDKPFALRLTDEQRQHAIQYAKAEGRSASNFVRLMYLRGVTDYERQKGPFPP